jgi:hypothetical protein
MGQAGAVRSGMAFLNGERVQSPSQPAVQHPDGDHHAPDGNHQLPAGSSIVSGGCWSQTTAAATIDPGAAAIHHVVADGPGGGGLGPVRRSHPTAAAAGSGPKQGRGGRACGSLLPPRGWRRPPAWRLGAFGRAPLRRPKPARPGFEPAAGRTSVLPLPS